MAAMLTKEVQHNLQSAFKGDDDSVGGGDGVDGGGGISCKSSIPPTPWKESKKKIIFLPQQYLYFCPTVL